MYKIKTIYTYRNLPPSKLYYVIYNFGFSFTWNLETIFLATKMRKYFPIWNNQKHLLYNKLIIIKKIPFIFAWSTQEDVDWKTLSQDTYSHFESKL